MNTYGLQKLYRDDLGGGILAKLLSGLTSYAGKTPNKEGHGKQHGARGIFIGDRLAVFLASTDIHCGWVDASGRWFGKRRGSNRQGHTEAIQMGTNLVMYALSH